MEVLRARDKKDLGDRLLQTARTEEKAGASQMQTVHIVDGGLTPRKPTWVRPSQAVLENPSVSPIGLILISSTFSFIPIYSLVLLYWAFRATDRTLHLHPIPKNRSGEKAIEEHEKCQSISVDKPPRFGTRHGVPGVPEAVINPADLKFTYIGPKRKPYTRHMEEGTQLSLTKQKYFTSERARESLWTAFLRAGDMEHPASVSDPPTGRSTGKTTRDFLVNTLDDLGESELKNFKSKLTDIDLKEGYDHIPKGKLENAKSLEVTDLLIGHYTMDYALEVTMTVLEAINRKDLARRLRSVTRTRQESAKGWLCLPVPQGGVEHPASVSDPPSGRSRGKTTRDLLVNTLDDLGESELKNFKSKLTDIDLKEGYDHIPKGKLENAKSTEVTDLLIRHYTVDYVMEVTTIVLEAINRKDLARRLGSVTGTGDESDCAWPCLPVFQGVSHKYPYSPLLYSYKFCTMHALQDILKVLIF
ncbi:uncharacterized protein LOC117876263 isoform X1 [Trachemys scripta elegans]|uniref:uncharacterized protein LOC117876263 isoform X1 n=1 Tax=Trachemys scripta elegans TaxID=31138 RepID=UPI001555D8AC|nr:uncharacterized protein LOC117876263 isoform X1 [Trachemys scripta elegans]